MRRMAQKVGEEGLEFALASVAAVRCRSAWAKRRICLYHVLLLLKAKQLSLAQIVAELEARRMKASSEIARSSFRSVRGRFFCIADGTCSSAHFPVAPRQELGRRTRPSRAMRPRRSASSLFAPRIPRSKYFLSLCISYPNCRGCRARPRGQSHQLRSSMRRFLRRSRGSGCRRNTRASAARSTFTDNDPARATACAQGLDARLHRARQSRDAGALRPGVHGYARPHHPLTRSASCRSESIRMWSPLLRARATRPLSMSRALRERDGAWEMQRT